MECPTVHVGRGLITLSPQSNCNFTSLLDSSQSISGLFKDVPGRWYGPIEYNCGQCYGKLICKVTSCDECLFCSHNENILQCRSVFVPLFLGLLTGVLVTILTMKIIKVLHKTILEKFISSLINLIHSFYKNNKSKLERQVRDTILTDIRQNYDLSLLDFSHKSDQNKLSIVWSVKVKSMI